jgi:peptidoglycan/LPS O-acetylase OafA/YrhL
MTEQEKAEPQPQAAVQPVSANASPAIAVEDLKPLTSLRFFAAFAIVILHSKLYMKWGWAQSIQIPLAHGVSFFFVLSGFILTHVYHARHDIGYSGFIRLRLARIWPVHLATLLLVVWFIHPATFQGTDPRLVLLANATLTHALIPVFSYYFAWNSVSWSISTEMCFYLCFPFLVARVARYWWLIVLLSALVVVALCGGLKLAGLPANSDDVNAVTIGAATYANPLNRGLEFCLGMAAWVLWNRYSHRVKARLIPWTLVELAVVGATWVWISVWFPRLPSLGPAWLLPWFVIAGSCWVFAIVIATFAGGHGVLGRILSSAPMVWLGEISFAMYMVHQILFKIATRHSWMQSEFAFFLALIAASAALHYVIERPGRALLSGRFSKKPRVKPLESSPVPLPALTPSPVTPVLSAQVGPSRPDVGP